MGDKVTLADLDKGQAVILEKIDNIKEDVNTKHAQNRSSIHDLKNDIHEVCEEVWKLKVKIAGYAAVSGVITAICIHYVEKLIGK